MPTIRLALSTCSSNTTLPPVYIPSQFPQGRELGRGPSKRQKRPPRCQKYYLQTRDSAHPSCSIAIPTPRKLRVSALDSLCRNSTIHRSINYLRIWCYNRIEAKTKNWPRSASCGASNIKVATWNLHNTQFPWNRLVEFHGWLNEKAMQLRGFLPHP
jgi:hypothetical protein